VQLDLAEAPAKIVIEASIKWQKELQNYPENKLTTNGFYNTRSCCLAPQLLLHSVPLILALTKFPAQEVCL
jgi:hypothetical protein